ncbi:amidase signature domain-containing protein [Rhexocercosporidium sp. MPI-PUGE-AT-0058]|nr:amidase signature domain-containing protein [Rhexocercosporidium sp. MPI-PUGE-AT-0058]
MATEAKLDMPTSAGAYVLQNATATSDAFLIVKAREAGEFGGFKDNDISPSWSSLGGETLSPYDHQHPCGSSGGPVVAVVAGFAPVALGTEIQGSISCPASFIALYGFKTSTGLLSRAGILPSSTSFDSPGVFAKISMGYSKYAEHRHKMKPGMEKFLQSLSGTNIKTLADLVKWNQERPDLAGSKRKTCPTKNTKRRLPDPTNSAWKKGLELVFDKYDLDAIVAPAWTQMSIYAAWSGSPRAAVPLSQYKNKKPYGLGFVGRRFGDEQLLQIMNLYEISFPRRLTPERMHWKRWGKLLPAAWTCQ